MVKHDALGALAALSEDEVRLVLGGASDAEAFAFDADWESWVREGQAAPEGAWRQWVMLAGRGFGKTRAGAEYVSAFARAHPGAAIALVGATAEEARAVMVEGPSGLLAVARADEREKMRWQPSLKRLVFASGAEARLYSAANPESLRGPEHHLAWCDELAKWRQAETAWNNLFMALRGGPRARALITTTPRPMRLLDVLRQQSWTVQTGGKTKDNINLPRNFVDVMVETYGGTRLGRQELDGELIADVEGALWTREMVAGARVRPLTHATQSPVSQTGETSHPRPHFGRGEGFARIVVGVDPPAGMDGDACGIVVCGRGVAGLLYVLEDASVAGLSPEGWSNRVSAAAARWGASLIVAEANNGGAMVKSVLDAAEAGVRVKLVHASKGKSARAEPVALRFEKGRVKLAGDFPELESELCGLVAGGGYEGPGNSPDRADAMVWALTELGETKSGLPRIVRL